MAFAERRFADGGRGVLFTNGTGTGKTFSGLGIIARSVRNGRPNIIITAPGESVINSWVQAARKHFGIEIHKLADTNDAGPPGSVVITTYANFYQNAALLDRQWDMIVHDESHKLMENQAGEATGALDMSRALTGHPRGAYAYASMKEATLLAEIAALDLDAKLARTSDDQRQWHAADGIQAKADAKRRIWEAKQKEHVANRAALWESKRTRRVDLSATPFAYEKSVDMAEGFLFDYGPEPDDRGYNTPSAREAFMIEHFGYRMRTGKLTEPDAKVDRSIMQRAFNRWLKQSGALSGRMLDVDFDYSREFVAVNDLIGNKIDAGMEYIRGRAHDQKDPMQYAFREYLQEIEDAFDYNARIRLLEAIKAPHAVARAKQHIAMGRKVVIFHSRIQGGSSHPFDLSGVKSKDARIAMKEFALRRPDLWDLDLGALTRPLDLFKREFGDRVTFYNGTLNKKAKVANPVDFNIDTALGGKYDVIVVQDEGGKEGISLHDTTGAHQRALMNIGLPVKPTQAIQIEGRAYRVGQQSDAIFEYFNTGTSFERWTFAQKISERASTAENLAMGDSARRLRDSFVDAFEEPTSGPANAQQGKGGKERDKALEGALTPFQEAKTHYFGNQKASGLRDQRAGVDYFATPEPLGVKMVEWAGMRPGESALEPSAGHGAIARYFPGDVRGMFVEPSSDLASRLALRTSGTIRNQRFEDVDEVNKFDTIVMNPPFGQGGKTAAEHVAKAMNHLKNGGRIVALVPEGPAADKRINKLLYGNDLETYLDPVDEIDELRQRLKAAHKAGKGAGPIQQRINQLTNFHVRAEIGLPTVTFERAGTAVKTRILIIDRVDVDSAKGREISQRSRRDIDADDINQFFDSIENQTAPERLTGLVSAEDVLKNHGLKLVEVPEGGTINHNTGEEWQYELSGKTYDNRAVVSPIMRKHGGSFHADEKLWTAKTDPTEDLAKALQGLPVEGLEPEPEAPAQAGDRRVIEHVTAAGNTIRGVVVPKSEMTKDQAKSIDKFTFMKNGGWFIRERHLAELAASAASAQGGAQAPASRFYLGGTKAAVGRHAITRRPGPTAAEVVSPRYLQARLDAHPLVRALREQHGLPVRVARSAADMPEEATAELERIRKENPDAFPKALWVPESAWALNAGNSAKPVSKYLSAKGTVDGPQNGEIIVIADAVRDVPEALALLLQEGVGHFGLTQMLGPRFGAFLDEVAKDYNQEIEGWARAYRWDMEDQGQRRRATEEFLAHTVRIGPDAPKGLLERVMQAIRRALRAMGFRLRLNDADLREVIGAAHQYAMGDRGAAVRMKERVAGLSGDQDGSGRAQGPRAMFAGQGAKTADPMSLASAQKRLSAGEDPEAVRKATGWHQGADGKWRFEIDDSNAMLSIRKGDRKNVLFPDGQPTVSGTLIDVLDHPEMFAAYPHLSNVFVSIVKGSGLSGQYNPPYSSADFASGKDVGSIEIYAGTLQDAQWILFHEIQHVIQRIEGFSVGSSPDASISDLSTESLRSVAENGSTPDVREQAATILSWKKNQREAADKIAKNYRETEAVSNVYRAYKRSADTRYLQTPLLDMYFADRMERLSAQREEIARSTQGSFEIGYDLYRRILGEAEARNVQTRKMMTADERKATPPSATQDVPDSDVIVVWNGREMASAPRPENSGQPSSNPLQLPAIDAAARTAAEDVRGKYWKYGDAIDPAGNWRRFSEIPDDADVVLYHATSRENALAIMRDGYSGQHKVWTNTPSDYVYMGNAGAGGRGLGTYIGPHTGSGPALVAFRVRKGDIQPDAGTDWKTYVKGRTRELRANGVAPGAPTAVDTYAHINQVRAHVSKVTPIAVLNWETMEPEYAAPRFGAGQSFGNPEQLPETVEIDGVERPTTNSEGRPIHPTLEGVRNFWRWYSGSRFVDKKGRPFVFYHGTVKDFSVFDSKSEKQTQLLNDGVHYFSSKPQLANAFAVDIRKNNLAVSRWSESETRKQEKDAENAIYSSKLGGNVIPVYLKSGRLQVLDKRGSRLTSWVGDKGKPSEEATAIESLQDGSADSVLFKNTLDKDGVTDHIIVVRDPEQIKSAIGNTGAFSPSNPDIRFAISAPGWMGGSPTVLHAGNEAIRKANITLWDKAKSQLRRQLSPGGNLPRQVFGLKIDRDSQFEAAEMDIRSLLSHFERAVLASYGKAFDKLPETDKALLGEALRFDDAAAMDQRIPEPVRMEVLKLRQYIDALSSDYAGILFDEASALLAAGRDEQAAQRAALLETIAGNIGEYVHRSYRAFDDPKWVEKVPDEVLNDARRYLTERNEEKAQKYDGWADKADDRGEADKADRHRERAAILRDTARIDKTLRLILTEGKAFDSMEAFIKEAKLGQMDLTILKRRKDIAPEIRALLGEYTDPRLNFAKSATKMSRLIWNNRFLKRVLDIGKGDFLFRDKEAAPMDVTRKIAASPSYAPLDGYYTTPEIEEAFRDILGKEDMADWYRAVVQANGMVKFGKTVLSPTTALRNWMSSYFFTVANGHFDMRPMDTALKAWHEYRVDQDQGRLFAYLRHLKTLGVVYDTPFAGEMMKLLEDARLEEQFRPEQWTKVRNALDVARKFYSFGDDFWKIVGFENEKALLMKHKGMSEQDAETAAAERIRNTYPTYSMTGRFIQGLRRFPLVGTFVSFPAEIIRTTANMLYYLRQDLQDPALRPLAIRRATGLAIASGFTFAAQAAFMALLGVDDDEEEAFRKLAAPWQKNSQLLPVGRDDKGNLRFIDLSFLDPYNYFKRPIVALLRDQPLDDALKSAARDAFSPFFGIDIAAGAIYDVLRNGKDTGGQVFNPQDSVASQTGDILNHLRKTLQPGVATNLERAIKAAAGDVSPSGQQYSLKDELLANLGFRVSTFNPRTALYFKSFEFNQAKADANQILLRTLRDPNRVSDGDIESAFNRASRARRDAYASMATLTSGAKSSGMAAFDVRAVLRKSGISAKDIDALMRGTTPKMEPSAQFMSGAFRKAGAIYTPETAAEFRRRRAKALELMRK